MGHVSALNVVQERPQDYLELLKPPQYSTATPSRPDFSAIGSETMSTSMRHTRGRGEGPWLADPSRQYIPPQHSSAHSTPRISSYSLLPRIRASSSADNSQRPLDEWAISQKSYLTPLSLPTGTSGHPYGAPGPDNLREFPYVKHETDADLIMPPPRLGFTYMSHQAPPIPAFVSFAISQVLLLTCAFRWEASAARESQYNESATRDGPGSSLLSHLRGDPTPHSPHGTGGSTEHDSTT